MRLFVGIPLASEITDALGELVGKLRSTGDGLRWSSPGTWHITLQFLGETSEATYGCIAGRLSDVQSPVVPIRLEGTGVFERAGVFFAGANVSAEMLKLEKCVRAATAQCGLVAETRPFHPHVTLARAKGPNRVKALREVKQRLNEEAIFTGSIATEFFLYQVFLGPGGPRYEVRERFRLGSGYWGGLSHLCG